MASLDASQDHHKEQHWIYLQICQKLCNVQLYARLCLLLNEQAVMSDEINGIEHTIKCSCQSFFFPQLGFPILTDLNTEVVESFVNIQDEHFLEFRIYQHNGIYQHNTN